MANALPHTSEPPVNHPDETRVVLIILVDRRGYILLHHRDGDATAYPNRWGLVGGVFRADETPDAAARRKVAEETGLRLPHLLELFTRQIGPPYGAERGRVERFVYATATDARQEEVTSGMGRALTFMAPGAALTLDLIPSVRDVIGAFLASSAYERIVTAHPGRADK